MPSNFVLVAAHSPRQLETASSITAHRCPSSSSQGRCDTQPAAPAAGGFLHFAADGFIAEVEGGHSSKTASKPVPINRASTAFTTARCGFHHFHHKPNSLSTALSLLPPPLSHRSPNKLTETAPSMMVCRSIMQMELVLAVQAPNGATTLFNRAVNTAAAPPPPPVLLKHAYASKILEHWTREAHRMDAF